MFPGFLRISAILCLAPPGEGTPVPGTTVCSPAASVLFGNLFLVDGLSACLDVSSGEQIHLSCLLPWKQCSE